MTEVRTAFKVKKVCQIETTPGVDVCTVYDGEGNIILFAEDELWTLRMPLGVAKAVVTVINASIKIAENNPPESRA